jgi:hypothetical protein
MITRSEIRDFSVTKTVLVLDPPTAGLRSTLEYLLRHQNQLLGLLQAPLPEAVEWPQGIAIDGEHDLGWASRFPSIHARTTRSGIQAILPGYAEHLIGRQCLWVSS